MKYGLVSRRIASSDLLENHDQIEFYDRKKKKKRCVTRIPDNGG